jgi:hypothetical protein
MAVVLKEVPAFLWDEEGTGFADGLPEGIDGSGVEFSEKLFGLGEGHLDGIERVAGRASRIHSC